MRRAAAVAAIAVAAAGASVAAGGAAAALPPANGAFQTPDPTSGQLEIQGSGRIAITGRASLTGSILTSSVVTVRDRAGDAEIYARGRQVTLRGGVATVRRTRGILFVRGSNLALVITGSRNRVSVAGSGITRLTGSGTYRLNMGATVAWPRTQFTFSATARPSGTQAALRAARRAATR